ncbi:MAG: hypothetical protein V4731_06255 [Pseudomonadota bacterium]
MYLSEYVVVDTKGGFLDPLAFMRPASAFQAVLFRQFTGLSNHPAYHGVLCAVWKYLHDRGLSPTQPGFSRRFREIEIFWGLLNAIQGVPVLNVRKYKPLTDDNGEFSLRKVPKQHSLYARLAYGTLGHYTQPSIAWGFLQPGGKAMTDDGFQLARAMEDRCSRGFQHWLDCWSRGDTFELQQCQKLAASLHLLADATRAEKSLWQAQINRWVEGNPRSRPIWEDPVPLSELDEAQVKAEAHTAHYHKLVERYPTLAEDIVAMSEFERLSGAVQFLFDRKLLKLQFTSSIALSEPSVLDELPGAIVKLARRAAARGSSFEPVKLFSTLAESDPTLEAIETAICDHHTRHQKRKGVTAFLDETGLLVGDTVDPPKYAEVLESLQTINTVEAAMDLLQFRSGRDWHFRRCRVYSDWTGASP